MQLSVLLALVIATLYFWYNNSENFMADSKPSLTYEAPKPIQQPVTVAEAYRAIPHQRTTFRWNTAQSMSSEEAQYLQKLFTLVDVAVVERVVHMRAIQLGQSERDWQYMEILRQLDALQPPESLQDVHNTVMVAINQHYKYLQKWQKAGGNIDLSDSLVIGSHKKLIKAYEALMLAYPNENNDNKQAFFDHLCALDFI